MSNDHELYIAVHSNEFFFVFVTVNAEALQLEGTLNEKEGARLKPNTEGFAFI